MAAFLRWYQAKLAMRPLLTQSVTTGVLFATGDALAQTAVEKRALKDYDVARSGRMALYGGAIFGPLATKWFGFLQNRVRLPGRPNAEILARVGLDQAVLAPTNLFMFLNYMAIMEGSDPKQKIDSTYKSALTKNWMVWPFVQLVNFKFTPLQHRVLVVNVVSLGWNCYLSYLNSQGGSDRITDLPPS